MQMCFHANIFSDPPVVEIWHTNDDRGKSLRCKADGNPEHYTYKMCKHLSLYNEHIRDINSPGILRFGLNDGSAKWNQDDGYYICRVSNGITDKDGKLFQTAIETVASKGTYQDVLQYILMIMEITIPAITTVGVNEKKNRNWDISDKLRYIMNK